MKMNIILFLGVASHKTRLSTTLLKVGATISAFYALLD
jgi:hypothetical protein